MSMGHGKWERVKQFLFLFAGRCDFKAQISHVPLLLYDQSANCKGQGCDFSIPLPIFPSSTSLILTQKDSTNSFLQIWVCVCKPSLPVLLGNKGIRLIYLFLFIRKYTLRRLPPKHIQSLLLGFFEDTAHLLYINTNILNKAASGTTVIYALSMMEHSSIMKTSIQSLFLHHLLDLREKILPRIKRIPLMTGKSYTEPGFSQRYRHDLSFLFEYKSD